MPVIPERANAQPSMVRRPVIGSTATLDTIAGVSISRRNCEGDDARAAAVGFVTLDQDGADLVLHIVEAVAHDDADLVFAGGHIGKMPDEAKARIARHGDVAMLVADILARQPEFSVAMASPSR